MRDALEKRERERRIDMKEMFDREQERNKSMRYV